MLQHLVIPLNVCIQVPLLRAITFLDTVPMMQVEKVKKAVETAKRLRSDLYLEGEYEAGCRFAMGNSPIV